MGLIQRAVRWYKLNHGIGNVMLSAGAELLPCPHCDTLTPVYRSTYDSNGDPLSFSVCLWCDGFIEYSETLGKPQTPYTTARDRQLNRQSNR